MLVVGVLSTLHIGSKRGVGGGDYLIHCFVSIVDWLWVRLGQDIKDDGTGVINILPTWAM